MYLILRDSIQGDPLTAAFYIVLCILLILWIAYKVISNSWGGK